MNLSSQSNNQDGLLCKLTSLSGAVGITPFGREPKRSSIIPTHTAKCHAFGGFLFNFA
jgi:hypothetical protein